MFQTENSMNWTVSSEFNGLSRAEAKARGWFLKREGRMRRYYKNGVLQEAYSYNTCIAALQAPSEDFPMGRYILNLTAYSMTTTRHQNVILSELHSDWMAVWCFTGKYSGGRDLSAVLRQACDVYGIKTDTTASELRKLDLAEINARHFQSELSLDKARKLERRAAKGGQLRLVK